MKGGVFTEVCSGKSGRRLEEEVGEPMEMLSGNLLACKLVRKIMRQILCSVSHFAV